MLDKKKGAANPFAKCSGNLFGLKTEKEEKKSGEKNPFAMALNTSLFGAPSSGNKDSVEEDKKFPLPPKTSSPSLLTGGLNPPEVKIEDQVKLMSFEEFKATGMNGKTMSETFNKWRSKLIGIANEMKGTEKELQEYEGQLLDLIKKAYIQIQTVDLANEITQQQKIMLIKLKNDQVFFISSK
jgi:hypothetical protein